MTMSEYILEQSISTATCSDIELERSLAEMNVLAEMCRCYEKAEMFSEYASDESVVAECGIFLEADKATENNEEKKKKTFKSFIESAKTVLSNIWQKFVEILEKLFADSTTKALEKIPDGTIIVPKDSQMYALALRAFMDSERIEFLLEDFIKSIKSGDTIQLKKMADKQSFNGILTKDINDDNNYGNIDYYRQSTNFTKETMMECLDKLKKTKSLQKSRNLMNEVKTITDLDKGFYDGNIDDIKAAVKNITEYIRETVKYVTYVYDECIKLSARRQKVYDKAKYGKMGAPRNKDGE